MTTLDADAIVVGYGPVGQTVAALLGREGHRLAVYERVSEIYALPRAIHFDDEIMRIWQQLGIVDEIEGDLMPSHRYTWFGADGEPILEMTAPPFVPSGWEPGYLFFQPQLEAARARAAKALPVTVHRGWWTRRSVSATWSSAWVSRSALQPRCTVTGKALAARARAASSWGWKNR